MATNSLDILNRFKEFGAAIGIALDLSIQKVSNNKLDAKRVSLLKEIGLKFTKDESRENKAKFFQVLLNIQDEISRYINHNIDRLYEDSGGVFDFIMRTAEKKFEYFDDSTSQLHWSKMKHVFQKLKEPFKEYDIVEYKNELKLNDYKRTIEYVTEYFKKFSSEEAVNNGSCFFDSFAKSLNQQKGYNVTYKELREICRKFATDAQGDDLKWLKESIENRHVEFQNMFSSFSSGNVPSFQGTVDSYITAIMEDGFWGAPELEGKILCKKYGVKLHVLERLQRDIQEHDMQEIYGQQLDKGTCVIVENETLTERIYEHNLVTGEEGSRSLDSTPSELISGYNLFEPNDLSCGLIKSDSGILQIFGDDVVRIMNEGHSHFRPFILKGKYKDSHKKYFNDSSHFPDDQELFSRIEKETEALKISSIKKILEETKTEFVDRFYTNDKKYSYSLIREELSSINESELSQKLKELKDSINKEEFKNLGRIEKPQLLEELSTSLESLSNQGVEGSVNSLSNEILNLFQLKEIQKFKKALENNEREDLSKKDSEGLDEEDSSINSIMSSSVISKVSNDRRKA